MTRRRKSVRPRAWLALAILMLALLPATVSAAGDTGTVFGTGGDGVWLKQEPALDAPRIVALPEGTPLRLLAGPQPGTGNTRSWVQVQTGNTTGWMVADYFRLDGGAAPPPPTPAPSPAPPSGAPQPGGWGEVRGTTGAGGLRLRAASAPWEQLLTILPEGTRVQIVAGPTTGGNGDPWYQVDANGTRGWVDGIYLVAAEPPAPPAPPAAPPAAPTAGASFAVGSWVEVTGTNDVGGLRLRGGPAPTETLLRLLPDGTKLQIAEGPVTGSNGDPWYRVDGAGQGGWVDGIYLNASSAPSPGAAPAPPGPGAQALVQVALQQVGKRYAWGGVGPDAFDCSGLVYYAARVALGITLPRVAADQASAGVHVDPDQLQPGDLVFYANTYQPGISHVGIYIGGRRWVTAQDERTGVVIVSLDEPYWKTRYVGARRIT